MAKKSDGEVTLGTVNKRLDTFEGTLNKFEGALNKFEGSLSEFKVTLGELSEMLGFVVKHMATKDDIAEVRKDMATKGDLFALQTQVNNIESDIRYMKNAHLEVRVADLEEKVFGKAR